MKCARPESQVFLHAHGQLGSMERLFMESHLERCSTCRAHWSRCMAERDALRHSLSPLPEPSCNMPTLADEVRVRIRQVVAEERRAPRSNLRVRRVAVLALAAILLLGLSAAAAFWPNGRGLLPALVGGPRLSLPPDECLPGGQLPAGVAAPGQTAPLTTSPGVVTGAQTAPALAAPLAPGGVAPPLPVILGHGCRHGPKCEKCSNPAVPPVTAKVGVTAGR